MGVVKGGYKGLIGFVSPAIIAPALIPIFGLAKAAKDFLFSSSRNLQNNNYKIIIIIN